MKTIYLLIIKTNVDEKQIIHFQTKREAMAMVKALNNLKNKLDYVLVSAEVSKKKWNAMFGLKLVPNDEK